MIVVEFLHVSFIRAESKNNFNNSLALADLAFLRKLEYHFAWSNSHKIFFKTALHTKHMTALQHHFFNFNCFLELIYINRIFFLLHKILIGKIFVRTSILKKAFFKTGIHFTDRPSTFNRLTISHKTSSLTCPIEWLYFYATFNGQNADTI